MSSFVSYVFLKYWRHGMTVPLLIAPTQIRAYKQPMTSITFLRLQLFLSKDWASLKRQHFWECDVMTLYSERIGVVVVTSDSQNVMVSDLFTERVSSDSVTSWFRGRVRDTCDRSLRIIHLQRRQGGLANTAAGVVWNNRGFVIMKPSANNIMVSAS